MAATSAGDLRHLLSAERDAGNGNLPQALLAGDDAAAFHREPAQLERVALLLNVLRKGARSLGAAER